MPRRLLFLEPVFFEQFQLGTELLGEAVQDGLVVRVHPRGSLEQVFDRNSELQPRQNTPTAEVAGGIVYERPLGLQARNGGISPVPCVQILEGLFPDHILQMRDLRLQFLDLLLRRPRRSGLLLPAFGGPCRCQTHTEKAAHQGASQRFRGMHFGSLSS